MRLRDRWRAAIVVAVMLSMVGCKGPASPSQNVTEILTGTVSPRELQASTFFTVGRRGEYTITFVSLNPPASVFLSVALWAVINGVCGQQVSGTNTAAGRGQVVLGGPIEPGTYCVIVADPVGLLSGPTAFTFSAFHP